MNEVAYAKNQFLVWLELMRIAARALEKKLHSDTKDYADYLSRLVDEGWAKEPNGSPREVFLFFVTRYQHTLYKKSTKRFGRLHKEI